MPKNKGKGGKNFRKGANKTSGTQFDSGDSATTRVLEVKDSLQEYAQVTKLVGGERILAKDAKGNPRVCVIPGRMRRKVWMSVGDVILIGFRTFQDNLVDVLHKYSAQDVRRLHEQGELARGTFDEFVDDSSIITNDASGVASNNLSSRVDVAGGGACDFEFSEDAVVPFTAMSDSDKNNNNNKKKDKNEVTQEYVAINIDDI